MRLLLTFLAVLVVAGCYQSAPQFSRPPAITPTFSPSVVGSPEASQMTPSPESPAPLPAVSPSPSPVGTAVARRVLLPATVVPLITLCTTPIDRDQDGNVGPLFCRDGSINVDAWTNLADVDSNILGLGRNPTVDQVKAAINADFSHPDHSTNVIEYSGYQLATAYYGWNLSLDYWRYVTGA